MIRLAPGTASILVGSTAGFTPYQQAGASTPCVIALSETVAPIEPETNSRTGSPVCSTAHAASSAVSSVDTSLPHDAVWKSEDATIQPLRTRAWSHGSSIRLSTPPVWPWKKIATPFGSGVGGMDRRTSWALSLPRMTSPVGASAVAVAVPSTMTTAKTIESGRKRSRWRPTRWVRARRHISLTSSPPRSLV